MYEQLYNKAGVKCACRDVLVVCLLCACWVMSSIINKHTKWPQNKQLLNAISMRSVWGMVSFQP